MTTQSNPYSHTTHTTSTGLTWVNVPRTALTGVILDANGQPSKVKHFNGRSYSDLSGINKEDYDSIEPDFVLYRLADGTFLQADPEVFIGSEMKYHHNSGKTCYNHQVNQLKVVSMPEFEAVPIIDLFDL